MTGGDSSEQWRDSYTRVRKDPFSTVEATNVERLRRLGTAALPASSTILDVGAGDGNLSRSLHALGFTDVIGVEYQPELLGAHPHRERTAVGSAVELPIAGWSVDAVVVMDVLHHLHQSDVPDALRELLRVLRPGGLLFICEPAATLTRRVLNAALQSPLHRISRFSRDKRALVDAEGQTFVDWLETERGFPAVVGEAGYVEEMFERRWLHHFGRWRAP